MTRNNYVPYLSEETKQLMKDRNYAKKHATRTGDPEKYDEYRRLRNLVKKKVGTDKTNYYKENFHNQTQTISGMWSTAYQFLGQTTNLSPVQLVVDGISVTSPRGMANAFNTVFIKKVKDLKED